MNKNQKIEDEDEKPVKRKKKKASSNRRGKHREKYVFTPPWHMPVRPSIIYSHDVQVRQLEYLDAVSQLSGSNEGNELESLSNLTHDEFKNYSFQENLDEFDEVIENLDE